jgi:sortase (surface protein transpeptidase)
MGRRAARHGHVQLGAGVAAVVLVALVVAGLLVARGFAQTADITGLTVTATSPITNLADGQRVTVNVKASSNVTVFGINIQQCKLDQTYQSSDDLRSFAGKCPNKPLSSSASFAVSRSQTSGVGTAAKSANGVTLGFNVGVGVVTWTPVPDGPETSITCDPDHQCALVTEILTNAGAKYAVFTLSFGTDDPFAACGGAAVGIVASSGPDLLQDAYTTWTKSFCTTSGAGIRGAPTLGGFGDEGAAVQSFANGTVDIAYTGAGYNPDVGFANGLASPRSALMVPIAIDASVLAAGGGYSQLGDKVPYPEIELTPTEIAALYGRGLAYLTGINDISPKIFARNPLLDGNLISHTPAVKPLAPSQALASTYYMSKFLTKAVPNDWVTASGDKRGAFSAVALANPPFPDVDLYTGRPTLQKYVQTNNLASSSFGPMWVITDLATARAFGMTPVSIQNSAGDFIAPTNDSMDAAVATMKPDVNGVLQPTFDAAGTAGSSAKGQGDAAPYPQTFIVYAMVPAEPLVDDSCTLRTSSQAAMTQWLNYITGPGQSELPDGLKPLTQDLQKAARGAIANVGASPLTGRCAGTNVAAPPGPAEAGTAETNAPNTGSFTAPSGSSSVPRVSAAAAPAAAATATRAASPNAESSKQKIISIPAFAGYRVPDQWGVVVAVVGVVLITSLGAVMTARRLSAGPLTWGSLAGVVAMWVVVAIVGSALVVYQLGPHLHQGDQRKLLQHYRSQIKDAKNASQGLPGVKDVTSAPERGSAVGVLEVGAIQSQEVVVEGVQPDQTRVGPGHVPGTAGLGQPGNAVIVARRNGFGGSFASLDRLEKGDGIVATTTQGQTLYLVDSVEHRKIVSDGDTSAIDTTAAAAPAPTTTPSTTATTESQSRSTGPTTTTVGATSTTQSVGTKGASASSGNGKPITVSALYGASKDDRLTLVTSATESPLNKSSAVVVVASMKTEPFAPTPQGGRTDSETGRSAEGSSPASLALAVLLYAGAVVGSVMLYRRLRFRVAYILTIAPLVALTVLLGQALAMLLPAWT